RGLKKYSNQITAIVTVTDSGASTGRLRKEFDMLAPGDIRKCISALAYDEGLISHIFEYRFSGEKNALGGHTLGNIWITALTEYLGSFDKAIEATTELFQTAGRVVPATLANVDLVIKYADGTVLEGESNLDEIVGKKIRCIQLNKKEAKAYHKAAQSLRDADLIVAGPGSLYGSIIPNLLIAGIRQAIAVNEKALKVYIVNCSTERTQTAGYSVEDHIAALVGNTGGNIFDYCLVNNKIISRSKDEHKLGEINNITTDKTEILGHRIILSDLIDGEKPLYHDSEKLAKSLINLYNSVRR
ncbi:MAG: gluconeogenesis factor YvcK family protein, partial [Patescibacteria group bacterium]